mgnify:CR=1 FL=1
MVGRNRVNEIVYHVLVSIGALIMVYPLLWMVLSSFKPTDMVLPTADRLIPTTWTLDNYTRGWKGFMGYSFGTFFANSFFISLVSTFGTLLSSAFVAYALQRLKFRMRKLLFVLVLSTMMLPAQILMIPQFMWYRHLNWVGTYYPMILPYFFAIQGFFVYLIMNFISGIPKSLDEAAILDGASNSTVFWKIILPNAKPVIATTAINAFINPIVDYIFVSVIMKDNYNNFTVAKGLYTMVDKTNIYEYYTVFCAGAVIVAIPVVLLFLRVQKYYVAGVVGGSVKG